MSLIIPQVPEDYVHRIGRTGRAGEEGIAVSLVSPEEKPLLQAIEKLVKKAIPRQVMDGFPQHAPKRDERPKQRVRTKKPCTAGNPREKAEKIPSHPAASRRTKNAVEPPAPKTGRRGQRTKR